MAPISCRSCRFLPMTNVTKTANTSCMIDDCISWPLSSKPQSSTIKSNISFRFAFAKIHWLWITKNASIPWNDAIHGRSPLETGSELQLSPHHQPDFENKRILAQHRQRFIIWVITLDSQTFKNDLYVFWVRPWFMPLSADWHRQGPGNCWFCTDDEALREYK